MFAASSLAWLLEGSEILHDVGRGRFVGLSLHMEEDLEPIKLSKAAHKPKCLCTVDVVLHPTVEDTPKGSKENKKNPRLHSGHPVI